MTALNSLFLIVMVPFIIPDYTLQKNYSFNFSFDSLINSPTKIKIYVGVDAIIVSILNFDTLCLISVLLRWFDDGPVLTILLL